MERNNIAAIYAGRAAAYALLARMAAAFRWADARRFYRSERARYKALERIARNGK